MMGACAVSTLQLLEYAAVNIVSKFGGMHIFISVGYVARSGIAGQIVAVCVTF